MEKLESPFSLGLPLSEAAMKPCLGSVVPQKELSGCILTYLVLILSGKPKLNGLVKTKVESE